MLMSVGSAVTAPPRPVSPARTALPPRNSSPLNPLSRPRATSTHINTPTTSRIHLSNLDRLLNQTSQSQPQLPQTQENTTTKDEGHASSSSNSNGIFHALNLHSLFPSSRSSAGEMSPRSLTKLQRLLSDTSRPSPRNSIAPRWRQYHGVGDWAGLLDPLDENLRRELVRYGDLVQAAYHAFHSNPSVRPDRHRPVVLPDRNYHVTRSLYATASVELPRWVSGVAPWMAQRSSWVGYVAVCDNDREIHRMGRRDIVIALRGTATCLEWAENLRAGLVPIDSSNNSSGNGKAAKVECGFWSLYKTAGSQMQSLSASIVEEVRRLRELYKDEELSITVTGHSLGAALAVLVADELSTCLPKSSAAPPIAVFSFGGPRVGNKAFADRIEANGVKVLRVVNSNDVVTRVPLKMPDAPARGEGWKARVLEGIDGYADIGTELRVDSKVSPYLRPDADAACCHDLEAYLHLVDGFLGSHCPFRSNAKRSLARLLSQQGTNVKKLYMTKARDLAVDTAAVVGSGRSNVALPSPSH